MFCIGLIVGIIVGVIGTLFGWAWLACKITGISWDEGTEIGNLIIEAGQNRESTIMAYNDEVELGRVVLEEM